jgi:TrmH family RNA methyltransferase
MERDSGLPAPLSKRLAKDLRALHAKKGRLSAGQFLVETPKAVQSFLESGWEPVTVVGTSDWWATVPAQPSWGPQTAAIVATVSGMAEASALETPSSVLGVFTLPSEALPSGEPLRGIHLVLDGVRDPGNLGTIVRLADWFGAAGVWLSEDSADAFQPKVVQASMGSLARMPVRRLPLGPLLRTWQNAGIPLWATDMKGTPLAKIQAPETVAVVLGNEGRGISPEIRALCTEVVTIPRVAPGAESLNVANAAGIALYELTRAL